MHPLPFVHPGARIMTPLSYIVNDVSLRIVNENYSRAVLALHYFAKPVDRAIQAITVPFF